MASGYRVGPPHHPGQLVKESHKGTGMLKTVWVDGLAGEGLAQVTAGMWTQVSSWHCPQGPGREHTRGWTAAVGCDKWLAGRCVHIWTAESAPAELHEGGASKALAKSQNSPGPGKRERLWADSERGALGPHFPHLGTRVLGFPPPRPLEFLPRWLWAMQAGPGESGKESSHTPSSQVMEAGLSALDCPPLPPHCLCPLI